MHENAQRPTACATRHSRQVWSKDAPAVGPDAAVTRCPDLRSHLMEGRQPVTVCGVRVHTRLEKRQHLILVPRRSGCQEHRARQERHLGGPACGCGPRVSCALALLPGLRADRARGRGQSRSREYARTVNIFSSLHTTRRLESGLENSHAAIVGGTTGGWLRVGAELTR